MKGSCLGHRTPGKLLSSLFSVVLHFQSEECGLTSPVLKLELVVLLVDDDVKT